MDSHSDSPSRSVPAKCASCAGPLETPLFCGQCGRLYPTDDANHFELFGLAPGYDLDAALLRRRYLNLVRAIHPDRFPAAAAEVARLSERVSAQVNRAFQTLRDPVLRAEYLLEMFGGRPSAEDRQVPVEVLSDALALRERIERARADDDGAALDRLRGQVRRRCEESLAAVAALARRLPGDQELRRALRAALNTLRYYQRLCEPL